MHHLFYWGTPNIFLWGGFEKSPHNCTIFFRGLCRINDTSSLFCSTILPISNLYSLRFVSLLLKKIYILLFIWFASPFPETKNFFICPSPELCDNYILFILKTCFSFFFTVLFNFPRELEHTITYVLQYISI